MSARQRGAWRAPPAMAGPHHAALHPARAHRRHPFVLTEPAGCIRTPIVPPRLSERASRRTILRTRARAASAGRSSRASAARGPACGGPEAGHPPPPRRPLHRRSLRGQPTETTRSSTASRSVLFIYFFDLRKDAGYLFIYLFFPHRKTATMPNRGTGRRGPMISVSVTFFGVFDHWSSCPVDGRQSDFVPLGAGAVRGVG